MSFDCWLGLEHPLRGNCASRHNEEASIPNDRFPNKISCHETPSLLGTLKFLERPIRPDATFGIRPRSERRDLRCVTSLCRTLAFIPFATADRKTFFSLGRKHVVVHADHHRDENDRVVEKVEFDARIEKL